MRVRLAAPLAVASALLATAAAPATAGELEDLQRTFAARTGAALVFERDELPAGTWYDAMPALDGDARLAAARLLVREAGNYPAGWLGRLGLTRVGVFAALVSETGDGFRPYDDDAGGYLYYGLWNGHDAIAAAYYGDGQLPLTFHHEVFHHIDGADGFADDDARFAAALAGDAPYPALAIAGADLDALAARAGAPLADTVSAYTGKSPGEDQAETARWLMANLATGLWQATVRPELPGSQRILHVLATYAANDGPAAADLVDAALGRAPRTDRTAFGRAADAAIAGLLARLAPDGELVVWGRETRSGNPTLRADIARVAAAAEALAARAATPAARAAAAARLHDLLDRYQAFITARWSVSDRTARAFAAAHARVDRALAAAPANRYLAKVDEAIDDPAWRAAIRAVQPATVKLGGGSGVNLAPDGLVLTAGHVVDEVGATLTVRFPDGREFRGTAIAFDGELDLGLVRLDGAADLPVAALAAAPPRRGDDVVVIGQPGTRHPDGTPSGYQPWHVSVGHLRGFRAGDRTGEQHLGRAKHDAWTYWGHSGSPLFDRSGAIVALHNSWDADTAMRHAVTWEAIVKFLDDAR